MDTIKLCVSSPYLHENGDPLEIKELFQYYISFTHPDMHECTREVVHQHRSSHTIG